MKRLLFFVIALAVLAPLSAEAQVHSFGPRAGISVDPDQFAFGGQMKVGPLSEQFFLVPNLEIGVGDNLTVVQFNFDFDWMIPVRNTSLAPYVGGGLGILYADFDGGDFPGADGSTTEAGVNFLGGLEFANAARTSAFFTELRVGVGDIPDLKAMVGWNFGR